MAPEALEPRLLRKGGRVSPPPGGKADPSGKGPGGGSNQAGSRTPETFQKSQMAFNS